MAENTSSSRQIRSGRESFVERHRQLVFTLGAMVGGIIFAIGLIFVLLTIAIGTEPPGTRFAAQSDRAVVGAAGLVLVPLGSYIVVRSFKVAGW